MNSKNFQKAKQAINRLIADKQRGFADQLKLAMIDGKQSHSVNRVIEIIDSELEQSLKEQA